MTRFLARYLGQKPATQLKQVSVSQINHRSSLKSRPNALLSLGYEPSCSARDDSTHPRYSSRSMSHRCSASSGSILSFSPAHAQLFFTTEGIDTSYFKAPLVTSKSQQTTSEDAWALFISRYRQQWIFLSI